MSEQLLTKLGGCDSDSSDASSETEEDSIDELSGTESFVVLNFQSMSQHDIATSIFHAVLVSDVTQRHSYAERSIHSLAESIQTAAYRLNSCPTPELKLRLNYNEISLARSKKAIYSTMVDFSSAK
jgi:hypothetical protein